MAKNKIGDLRDHLFETLAALKDKTNPMEIDRAKAIADVARVVVESAKVEVEFVKATGAMQGSGFIPEEPAPASRQLPAKPVNGQATEQAERLARIERTAPPRRNIAGEEFETVWNGGEGLSSVGRTEKRA